MAHRLLLVEDDDDLRGVMAEGLAADDHIVMEARAAEPALELLAHRPARSPHPRRRARSRGRRHRGLPPVRRADPELYVMMLTARDAEADVVLALEAGADDYVTKPVGLAELRSRVRAALRRVRRGSADARSCATAAGARRGGADGARDGRPGAHLTPSEFAVLEALLVAGGAVRSRLELVRAIFGDDAYRDPRAVDVHVHHLREKLQAAGASGSAIATVRGAGYRIGG
jgi:DNA-binding response OmpR family regulator